MKILYSEYGTFQKRKNKLNELFKNKIKFNNKLYIIGMGAIGKPLLWLITKIFDMNFNNLIIIEERNIYDDIIKISPEPYKIQINTKITQHNYKQILDNLDEGDIIIELGTGIGTLDIIRYCNIKKAHFINSASSFWDDDCDDIKSEIDDNMMKKYSLYNIHKIIDKFNFNLSEINCNAIICLGCNPGNISIWLKIALLNLAEIEKINNINEWNKLAQKLGIQVIHISEYDSQIINKPKKMDEYCNTWGESMYPFYSESCSSVEISWGTHEKKITKYIKKKDINYNNDNYVILNKIALYTQAQSWVPYKEKFIGNLIPHDETYTIGKLLTISKNSTIIYKPSVYYIYHPCNDAYLSLDELKERSEIFQLNTRLLTTEIIDGKDIIGLTLFLENKNVYWIGSTLDINESRELFDNQINHLINATILQVIAGIFSGLVHIIELNNKKIYNGLMEPDDLPYNELIKYQLPFLGNFILTKINDYKIYINNNDLTKCIDATNKWTFNNFLVQN